MRNQLIYSTSLLPIIQNETGLYEGNLEHYVNAVWNSATNLQNPYHNFGHPEYMLELCNNACLFYFGREELTKRRIRNLLIAALVHDVNHRGMMNDDDDSINISFSNLWLSHHILECDLPYMEDIFAIVRATKFPHENLGEEITLEQQIIRDADRAQVFGPMWIQQVPIGLGAEKKISPTEMLRMQKGFLSGIIWNTAWAKNLFTEEVIAKKISEVERLLNVVDTTNNRNL